MKLRSQITATVLTTLMASALAAQPLPERELVIGTKEAAPFVMRTSDGSWHGISIELWQDVADRLGLRFRFVEQDLQGMVDGLKDSTLDAVVAALTMTPPREELFDFSHAFYTTGLGIAVSVTGGSGWLGMLSRLASVEFVAAVGALLILLALIGILVWFFERRKNPEQFGGSAIEGIGSGLWWSAVTMTTVGYGDKAPNTLLGRLVGMIWMFAAIIVVSGFTATIASSLTVSRLESEVKGPADLPFVKVGSIPNSTSAIYLKGRSVAFTGFNTPLEGLQALRHGEIDAFVYDAPILKYLTKSEFAGRVVVLPNTFYRQDYAIGLPNRSTLREPINRALLAELQQPEWTELLSRYLGPQ